MADQWLVRGLSTWLQRLLPDRSITEATFCSDLADGVCLLEAVSQVHGGSVGRYHKLPKSHYHRIENCFFLIKFLAKKGYQLSGHHDSHTMVDASKNLSMCITISLGALYRTLDPRGGLLGTGRELLEEWTTNLLATRLQDANAREEFPAINIPKSFSDGRVFLYLVEAVRPDSVELSTLAKKNPHANVQLAIKYMSSLLQMHSVIDPDAFPTEYSKSSHADINVIVVFLTLFRDAVESRNMLSEIPQDSKQKDEGRGEEEEEEEEQEELEVSSILADFGDILTPSVEAKVGKERMSISQAQVAAALATAPMPAATATADAPKSQAVEIDDNVEFSEGEEEEEEEEEEEDADVEGEKETPRATAASTSDTETEAKTAQEKQADKKEPVTQEEEQGVDTLEASSASETKKEQEQEQVVYEQVAEDAPEEEGAEYIYAPAAMVASAEQLTELVLDSTRAQVEEPQAPAAAAVENVARFDVEEEVAEEQETTLQPQESEGVVAVQAADTIPEEKEVAVVEDASVVEAVDGAVEAAIQAAVSAVQSEPEQELVSVQDASVVEAVDGVVQAAIQAAVDAVQDASVVEAVDGAQAAAVVPETEVKTAVHEPEFESVAVEAAPVVQESQPEEPTDQQREAQAEAVGPEATAAVEEKERKEEPAPVSVESAPPSVESTAAVAVAAAAIVEPVSEPTSQTPVSAEPKQPIEAAKQSAEAVKPAQEAKSAARDTGSTRRPSQRNTLTISRKGGKKKLTISRKSTSGGSITVAMPAEVLKKKHMLTVSRKGDKNNKDAVVTKTPTKSSLSVRRRKSVLVKGQVDQKQKIVITRKKDEGGASSSLNDQDVLDAAIKGQEGKQTEGEQKLVKMKKVAVTQGSAQQLNLMAKGSRFIQYTAAGSRVVVITYDQGAICWREQGVAAADAAVDASCSFAAADIRKIVLAKKTSEVLASAVAADADAKRCLSITYKVLGDATQLRVLDIEARSRTVFKAWVQAFRSWAQPTSSSHSSAVLAAPSPKSTVSESSSKLAKRSHSISKRTIGKLTISRKIVAPRENWEDGSVFTLFTKSAGTVTSKQVFLRSRVVEGDTQLVWGDNKEALAAKVDPTCVFQIKSIVAMSPGSSSIFFNSPAFHKSFSSVNLGLCLHLVARGKVIDLKVANSKEYTDFVKFLGALVQQRTKGTAQRRGGVRTVNIRKTISGAGKRTLTVSRRAKKEDPTRPLEATLFRRATSTGKGKSFAPWHERYCVLSPIEMSLQWYQSKSDVEAGKSAGGVLVKDMHSIKAVDSLGHQKHPFDFIVMLKQGSGFTLSTADQSVCDKWRVQLAALLKKSQSMRFDKSSNSEHSGLEDVLYSAIESKDAAKLSEALAAVESKCTDAEAKQSILNTGMSRATVEHHFPLMVRLLEAKANVNAVDNGQTLLHKALMWVEGGELDQVLPCVSLLVAHGLSQETKDAEGQDAISYLEQLDQADVVQCVKSFGETRSPAEVIAAHE